MNYNFKGKKYSFFRKMYENDLYISFYFALEFVIMNFFVFFQKMCCGNEIFKTMLWIYIFIVLQLALRFVLGLVYAIKIYPAVDELIDGKKTTEIKEIKLSEYDMDEKPNYAEEPGFSSTKTYLTFTIE